MEEVSPPGSHDDYMVDTSAYSAFKRGNKQAVEVLRHAERLVIPTIVLGELYAGFRLGARNSQNRLELGLFLRSTRVSTVEIDEATAERYAAIRHFLREAGTPVSANDMWIAASAMRHGLALLTCDSDFQRIPQIIVAHLVTD